MLLQARVWVARAAGVRRQTCCPGRLPLGCPLQHGSRQPAHLALKRRTVLLVAREAIDEEAVLAAVVHGLLQQADGDLRVGCKGGGRGEGCGDGGGEEAQPDRVLRLRVEQLRDAWQCWPTLEMAAVRHGGERPERTWEGTIWPFLIMSATIWPSGLPLFMWARSRSPALRQPWHTGHGTLHPGQLQMRMLNRS